MTAFGLREEDLGRIVSTIARESRVDRIILYGSRAKGSFRAGSDIDLSLVGPALDQAALAALEDRLEDLLLPWKIDLSLYHAIENAELTSHIRRVGKVLFRRDGSVGEQFFQSVVDGIHP